MQSTAPLSKAKWLNQNCACTSLEKKPLPELEEAGALFSQTPVFISTDDFKNMEAQIQALEAVIGSAAFEQQVLANAPQIAASGVGPSSVFMGYDFHLCEDGPKLIEINTNAGGAFLVDALYRAQDVCCWNGEPAGNEAFAQDVINMFRNEWRSAKHGEELKTVAIVDEDPTKQFLHGEFLIVAELLEKHGIKAVIADPAEFQFTGGKLLHNEVQVDLVYNRSVDFYLEQPNHAALRDAFIANAMVLTPNPRHHALYAAKQNLAILSDPLHLAALGATPGQIETLSLMPKSNVVNADNAEELWSARKKMFFKPLAGHGGKAVYRGDKITKKTWAHILEHDYVAQELAPPETRNAKSDTETGTTPLKSDIRIFTYQGNMLLAAARLYLGQTTNFRTVGGGFAPIYVT